MMNLTRWMQCRWVTGSTDVRLWYQIMKQITSSLFQVVYLACTAKNKLLWLGICDIYNTVYNTITVNPRYTNSVDTHFVISRTEITVPARRLWLYGPRLTWPLSSHELRLRPRRERRMVRFIIWDRKSIFEISTKSVTQRVQRIHLNLGNGWFVKKMEIFTEKNELGDYLREWWRNPKVNLYSLAYVCNISRAMPVWFFYEGEI